MHATDAEWASVPQGERDDLCWGYCEPVAVDWHARAVAAENELAEARAALRYIAWPCDKCGAVATSCVVSRNTYGTPTLAERCDACRGDTYTENKHAMALRKAASK
jgi:hypothetical protein